MKKILKLAIILIAAMLTLTGCVTVDYQVTINKDGTGKIAYVYGFDKSYLEDTGTSVKDMTEEMEESAKEEGFTVEPYEEGGVAGFKATKDAEKITEEFSLEEVFGADNVKDSEGNKIKIEKTAGGKKYSQKANIDLTSMEDMSLLGFTLQYTVNLPVKAGKNNATKVSDDGRTLTWVLKSGAENIVEFEATEGISMTTIIIVVGAIVGIGVVAFVLVLVLKKKKGNEEIKEDVEEASKEVEEPAETENEENTTEE